MKGSDKEMNIYVGNLSYQTTEEELRAAFGNHGKVNSVAIITDRVTGKSKGFGFVEMASDQEAREAISRLDGAEIAGRRIRVNEARPRAERGSGGGGYGERGGGHRQGGRSSRW